MSIEAPDNTMFLERIACALETQNERQERLIAVLERLAGTRPEAKAKRVERRNRISHMLAWVEKTAGTSQKDVAEHFGIAPSTLHKPAYEEVRQAIELNKLARRRILMEGDITGE